MVCPGPVADRPGSVGIWQATKVSLVVESPSHPLRQLPKEHTWKLPQVCATQPESAQVTAVAVAFG